MSDPIRMINDWEVKDTFGLDTFTKIRFVIHRKTAQKAALKIVFGRNDNISDSKTKQLTDELNILKKLKHQNIIQLIEFDENAEYPQSNGGKTKCIVAVLEYAKGGSLFDFILFTACLNETASRSYFQQMINGLEAMHKLGIAGHLKPKHLLLDENYVLKIAFCPSFTAQKHVRIPLLLNKHSISATVKQRYAVIVYEFDFENVESNGSRELRFDLTIDSDAFVSTFTANIDGELFYGITKEKYEAKVEYNTAKSKDENAILIVQPYANIPNVFQIRTNIGSKSKVSLSITIEQHLSKKFNFNELSIQILNDFNRYSIRKIYDHIALEIEIADRSGVYDINISNDIVVDTQIMDKSNQKCVIKAKLMNDAAALNEVSFKYKIKGEQHDSFVLYDNESGTFCHYISDIITDAMIAKQQKEDAGQEGQDDNIKSNILIPRRVAFVIDKSGSMRGTKWNNTISATITALQQLRPTYDRFCIILFDKTVKAYPFSAANEDSLAQTISYLNKTSPDGQTNVNDALLKAIDFIKNDIELLNNSTNAERYNFYMNQIIFITDGSPNVGVSDTKQILLNVKKENVLDMDKYLDKISIFSFGIGTDCNHSEWVQDLNHVFLKLLSLDNMGNYRRIKKSTADTTFDECFSILSKPILSNIQIEYDCDQNISNLTNTKFNALYSGNDLIICGKINRNSDDNDKKQCEYCVNATVSAITGKAIQTNERIITKPIKICKRIVLNIDANQTNDNIERIWAFFKLRQYAQIKLMKNENVMHEKEALSLAMKYKFITPWTSMIVVQCNDDLKLIANNVHSYPAPQPRAPSSSGDGGIEKLKTACGTKGYLSPELVKGKQYRHKCDIFSCGIILFTMYSGFPPFQSRNDTDWWWDKLSKGWKYIVAAEKQKYKKDRDKYIAAGTAKIKLFWKAHERTRQFGKMFKNILEAMLHPYAEYRCDINDIKKHKWYNGKIYNSHIHHNELKQYIQQRVNIVTKQRILKIEKELENVEEKYQTSFKIRAKELDPTNEFIKCSNHIKDNLFVNRTCHKFFTYTVPSEIAARFECIARRAGAKITISAIGCLVSFDGGGDDGDVLFSCKQYLVDENKRRYVVLFKRLKGSYLAYSNAIEFFCSAKEIITAMDLTNTN